MRIRSTLAVLLLSTNLAYAQALSPLGGSTNNAGSPPPALATPAAPTPAAPTTAAPAPTTPAPATTAPAAPARSSRAHRTMAERFAAANTTHDGKLTLEQAKAGRLNAVARDFATIDKSSKGYVTLDEIRAHQHDQRAARKAARDAKKAQ